MLFCCMIARMRMNMFQFCHYLSNLLTEGCRQETLLNAHHHHRRSSLTQTMHLSHPLSLPPLSCRTRALLGLRAREIHVCGGLEAEKIVRSLAESAGDEFTLQRYDRLSTLKYVLSALFSSAVLFF
jgi:hypothetical protein